MYCILPAKQNWGYNWWTYSLHSISLITIFFIFIFCKLKPLKCYRFFKTIFGGAHGKDWLLKTAFYSQILSRPEYLLEICPWIFGASFQVQTLRKVFFFSFCFFPTNWNLFKWKFCVFFPFKQFMFLVKLCTSFHNQLLPLIKTAVDNGIVHCRAHGKPKAG